MIHRFSSHSSVMRWRDELIKGGMMFVVVLVVALFSPLLIEVSLIGGKALTQWRSRLGSADRLRLR